MHVFFEISRIVPVLCLISMLVPGTVPCQAAMLSDEEPQFSATRKGKPADDGFLSIMKAPHAAGCIYSDAYAHTISCLYGNAAKGAPATSAVPSHSFGPPQTSLTGTPIPRSLSVTKTRLPLQFILTDQYYWRP